MYLNIIFSEWVKSIYLIFLLFYTILFHLFPSLIHRFHQIKTSYLLSPSLLFFPIRNQIWNLEAELKTGRETELALEEIGRRAIAIRDHNNTRIALKNTMAEKLNCPVREIKKEHLSE